MAIFRERIGIMENRNYFTERDVERLETQAVQIRQDIISMIHSAKAGSIRVVLCQR